MIKQIYFTTCLLSSTPSVCSFSPKIFYLGVNNFFFFVVHHEMYEMDIKSKHELQKLIVPSFNQKVYLLQTLYWCSVKSLSNLLTWLDHCSCVTFYVPDWDCWSYRISLQAYYLLYALFVLILFACFLFLNNKVFPRYFMNTFMRSTQQCKNQYWSNISSVLRNIIPTFEN